MDAPFDYENELTTKMGLKTDSSDAEIMLQKNCDAASAFYENQSKMIETTLNMLHQNMVLINENINGFAELFSSVVWWWVPPKTTQ